MKLEILMENGRFGVDRINKTKLLSGYDMAVHMNEEESRNEKDVLSGLEKIKNNPNVFRPNHYTKGNIETIDFIFAKELTYCTGNAIKYISRAKLKGNEIEDLEKAIFYLQMEVNRLRKDETEKFENGIP